MLHWTALCVLTTFPVLDKLTVNQLILWLLSSSSLIDTEVITSATFRSIYVVAIIMVTNLSLLLSIVDFVC